LTRLAQALRPLAVACLIVLLGTAAWAQPKQIDAVTKARELYNLQQYDAAIAAADKAGTTPATADAARLVGARARLERYRQSADPRDLELARNALREIRPDALSPRDRVELLVGLGEALYLDNLFGPAAELFQSALQQAGLESTALRDRVLDWWATSVDREAQTGAGDDRQLRYATLLDRVEGELSRDPQSTAATYWLSAAARGAGDLDRAWDAAIAGWVRASLTRDQGVGLRADLDHLVIDAIIPERARTLATSDADRARLVSEMQAQWTAIKQRWGGR
jgi:tetratricopeptide (TPR) repeat protein